MYVPTVLRMRHVVGEMCRSQRGTAERTLSEKEAAKAGHRAKTMSPFYSGLISAHRAHWSYWDDMWNKCSLLDSLAGTVVLIR
jgi:hypothetical protein